MSNTDSIKAHHLSSEELIVEAVRNNEGIIASNGAFSTSTGERTGRSPNDRFIVQEALHLILLTGVILISLLNQINLISCGIK